MTDTPLPRDVLADGLRALDKYATGPAHRRELRRSWMGANADAIEDALSRREPEMDVEWWTEHRVHPSQPWDAATRIRHADEAEARAWLGRWERGGVVVEARIIRSEGTIIESVVFQTDRMESSDV